jgi:hypothetical protein
LNDGIVRAIFLTSPEQIVLLTIRCKKPKDTEYVLFFNALAFSRAFFFATGMAIAMAKGAWIMIEN